MPSLKIKKPRYGREKAKCFHPRNEVCSFKILYRMVKVKIKNKYIYIIALFFKKSIDRNGLIYDIIIHILVITYYPIQAERIYRIFQRSNGMKAYAFFYWCAFFVFSNNHEGANKMKKLLIGMIGLLPLLYVSDVTTETNMATSYLLFLKDYWPLLLVGLITLKYAKKAYDSRFNELENMRYRHYRSEVKRYYGTPYVPAIMTQYLTNPPGAISPNQWDYINNRFYQMVVNDFRDNVYVFRDFNSFEPGKKNTVIDIVGWAKILRLSAIFVVSFGWFAYWIINNSFFNNWPFFTLPLLVVAWIKIIIKLQAIMHYLPSKFDSTLEDNSNTRIYWRDAFPDRPFGHTVLRAYFYEKEKRMRYVASLNNQPMGPSLDTWTHYAFPELPYPHIELPEWEKDYDQFYEQKAQQLNLEDSSQKQNVILFKKVT